MRILARVIWVHLQILLTVLHAYLAGPMPGLRELRGHGYIDRADVEERLGMGVHHGRFGAEAVRVEAVARGGRGVGWEKSVLGVRFGRHDGIRRHSFE